MLQILSGQLAVTGSFWPMQVAEISRVLKPGGIFVASTFLKASAPLGQLFDNDDLFRPLNAVSTFSRGQSWHGISSSPRLYRLS